MVMTGLLITALIGSVFHNIYQYIHISYILKLFKQSTTMATFQDLQTATDSLNSAATTIANAITAFNTTHTGDITSIQADIIVTAINIL